MIHEHIYHCLHGFGSRPSARFSSLWKFLRCIDCNCGHLCGLCFHRSRDELGAGEKAMEGLHRLGIEFIVIWPIDILRILLLFFRIASLQCSTGTLCSTKIHISPHLSNKIIDILICERANNPPSNVRWRLGIEISTKFDSFLLILFILIYIETWSLAYGLSILNLIFEYQQIIYN